ncbi:MAG: thiamine pyrophosphate-binding protein [Deltaproteobacteria bacterium]|jgi:sulfopyruvate decarboxylase subunit beta|nr:MAG: thiamine pyrophosphate-binding protein [Deltaproteobacteria bacterium]
MTRYECLELLAARISDQLVVTSQSGQRIEWSHLSKHEGNLLIGMMGCAVGVGMGLALALPHRKVIVLDSDGSILLSLFNLTTIGNLQPKNLLVYVFDNGVYSGSRISYPTATSGNTDLAAMAKGAGIKNAMTIKEIEHFKKDGLTALERNELGFFICKVEESLLHREIPRPTTDLAENKYTFVRYLERTEKKTIPFIGRG